VKSPLFVGKAGSRMAASHSVHLSWRLGVLAVQFALLALLSGCYALGASDGGGQNVTFSGPRRVNPGDVAVPPGYKVSVVATGLNFPTGVCCDGEGNVFVTEQSGRLLRINPDGTQSVIATGTDSPWSGVVFAQNAFFVATNGRILKITPEGKQTVLVDNLPTLGDFQTTGPAVADDGTVYFGEGAATNSGVVGPDNSAWITTFPQFHDIPAMDVKLNGVNVRSGADVTGAYSAYGTPTAPGQVIPAQVPATGCIMKIPAGGGDVALVAWGLRDPAGLAIAPDGRLFATERSYEVRGSRPVSGAADLLWAIEPGVWYGWPDYCGDEPLTWTDKFAAPNQPAPQMLLASHPNDPPMPAARLPVHGDVGGVDFCRSGLFGHAGEAFVAEFGDVAPLDGRVLGPVGFNVSRINAATGVIHVLAANKGAGNGPASKLGTAGLERPIAVRFDPSGQTLYVVDYGVVTVTDHLNAVANTGVLWKITREGN